MAVEGGRKTASELVTVGDVLVQVVRRSRDSGA